MRIKLHQTSPDCAKCKGKCCKNMAGIYWPEDFKELTAEVLLDMIRDDRLAIDYWEGESPVYWVRPPHVEVARIIDPSWGGQCIHLKEDGCALSWEERPTQCKSVKPDYRNGATYCDGLGKEEAADAWRPHQALMFEVMKQI